MGRSWAGHALPDHRRVGIWQADLRAVGHALRQYVGLYQKNSFEVVEHRFERDEMRQISNWWQERMRRSVQDIPSEWIDSAFSKLTRCTFQ